MNIFIGTIKDQQGELTSEESWHCAKVLRKKLGDQITMIDGKGNFYEGNIALLSDKKCVLTINSGPRTQAKRDYYLHLAIAPTKQIDRIEWMIEKAVEIGIDEISFIQCKNSERVVIKPERIQKIVESAVKQSLQAFIPKINELQSVNSFLKNANADQKFLAHCYEAEKKSIKNIPFKNKSSLVMIGPEGDFTLEEVKLAEENKFTALSLGPTRLRTETAGLYVCQAASLLD